MIRALLLPLVSITVCLLGAACACQSWSGSARITDASGHTLCAKHRTPLITVRAYRASDAADVDMSHGYIVAARCFPNRVPYRVSLHAGPPIFVHPVTITYCPVCERELEEEAARLE
jgi:hypothetical protein